MHHTRVSLLQKVFLTFGIASAFCVGSFIFVHTVHAASADVVVEKSLTEVLGSTELVLETVKEMNTQKALLVSASTDDTSIAALTELLQQLIAIYMQLLADQQDGGQNPAMTLTASPEIITAGESVKISWKSENTNYCTDGGGKTSVEGTYITDPITESKMFTMTCVGDEESVTKSVQVIVTADDTNTDDVIKVTVPNGGEEWDEGILNTVTWTPYGYNPDVNPARDVTAYLEKKNSNGKFVKVGKVQESGKASIHWITGELNSATQGGEYATPGDGYYIRVVNNETGAWDRSDAPFTLLPKPLEVFVNGSDEWTNIPTVNKLVTISWETTPGVSSCQLAGMKNVSFSTLQPSDGSVTGQIAYQTNDGGGISYGVYLQCVKNGIQITQHAKLGVDSIPEVQQAASLRILNPNGGELIQSEGSQTVSWAQENINSVSIALYKNDMWYKWIVKDMTSEAKANGAYSYTWDTKSVYGEEDPATMGKVFKIYITGQRSDGTGYVDDKSDFEFGFASNQTVQEVEKATYKGYWAGNQTPFITTNNISKAEALANCLLNHTNNATKGITCTWNGVEIYTFTVTTNAPTTPTQPVEATTPAPTQVSTPTQTQTVAPATHTVSTAPKNNRMSCASPLKTKLTIGSLACYGVWDYGDDFGNDQNMCDVTGTTIKTGCVIKTTACASGKAKTTKTISIPTATAAEITALTQNLGVTKEVLNAGMAQIWEYTCIANTTTNTTTSTTNPFNNPMNGNFVPVY